MRPFSSAPQRRRRPTPVRISTRPRRCKESTIWSTIYVNRSRQTGSHPPPCHRIRKGWEKKIAYSSSWGRRSVTRLPLRTGSLALLMRYKIAPPIAGDRPICPVLVRMSLAAVQQFDRDRGHSGPGWPYPCVHGGGHDTRRVAASARARLSRSYWRLT
jgi:hypothetical protein